jgi:hypothetical protein
MVPQAPHLAEVDAVYTAVPVHRVAADVLAPADQQPRPQGGPLVVEFFAEGDFAAESRRTQPAPSRRRILRPSHAMGS